MRILIAIQNLHTPPLVSGIHLICFSLAVSSFHAFGVEKYGSADGVMNRLDLVELDGLSVLSYISDTSPEFVCSDTRSRMLAEKVASNKIDTRPDCNTSSISPFLL